MGDREFRKERAGFLRAMVDDMTERRGIRTIGRVTQLTGAPSRVMEIILARKPVTDLPGGGIVLVQPLYMLYVFRQNGQAGMIVNRVSPFQYEQMMLTDAETLLVMEWAHKMVQDEIGRFTPADGGWMWWQK